MGRGFGKGIDTEKEAMERTARNRKREAEGEGKREKGVRERRQREQGGAKQPLITSQA